MGSKVGTGEHLISFSCERRLNVKKRKENVGFLVCTWLCLKSGKMGRPSRSLCFLLSVNRTRKRRRRIGAHKSHKGFMIFLTFGNPKFLLSFNLTDCWGNNQTVVSWIFKIIEINFEFGFGLMILDLW